VWSFNGGAVAIQPLSDGTLQGIVVSPTTFVACPHPVGQVMWTNIKTQADGSFWGLHQWYRSPRCEALTQLGLTAWRVLETSSGAHILKVCFNSPGGESRPTIATNGKEANVTYGCVESAPLAPLPVVTSGEGSGQGSGGGSGQISLSFGNTVVLPVTKACVRQSSLKITLRNPKYDPLKGVVVKINGRKVADVRGTKRLKEAILLKKLPSGTYKISVLAITVLNQRLSGSKTYHSCTKSSGAVKLHGSKSNKHH
jgi:hypothetical protein